MPTHMEMARIRNAKADAELLERRTKAHETKQRTPSPKKQRVITMDVIDGHARMPQTPHTVREAVMMYKDELGMRVVNNTLRAFYPETRRYTPGPSSDAFEHFLAVLRAFPIDLTDKSKWYQQESPHYNKHPSPYFHDMHALLFADRSGPATVNALRRVFLSGTESQ